MRAAERIQLAHATACADRARLLTPDNRAGATTSIAAAVSSGHAYFVTPHRDLLVVDVDLPRDPAAAADRLAAFDQLLDAAAVAGVPFAAVDSGRPGHRHGYLLTGTGPARARLERWAASRSLDVRTQGVRPPGSPHRLPGTPGVGADLSPAQTTRLLSVLAGEPDPGATVRLATALCPLELPARVLVAVRRGYAHAGYATPSHARMALAVGVRARGGSIRLMETILRDPTSPLGQTFRDRPGDWQRAELSRLWDKAGAFIASGGRGDPRAHLSRVAGAAAAWPWRGTAGGSDLAVLEALLRVGTRVRARTVGFALADIAVSAGVSTDTARAAVRRLVTAGWLHVVSRETATTTRTYDLRIPAGASAGEPVSASGTSGTFDDLGADIARRAGLGKVTTRVARAVDATPGVDETTLRSQLAMTAAALRYHLRKLATCGLLVRHGTGWAVRTGTGIVRALERRLGVDGAGVRHRALVVAQRAARAAARATFARLRRYTPPRAAHQPPAVA